MKKTEKFKSQELTREQYAQTVGARSKTVRYIDEGGDCTAKITTIDRNNGTIVQRFKFNCKS